MNRTTLIVLFVCIALVVGGMALSIILRANKMADHEAVAQATLTSFLDASASGDDAWRDFANENLLRAVPVGSPMRGEAETAEALDLQVTYELGELEFHSPGGAFDSDVASADITVTYTFSALGSEHTSTAKQEVWLTRPFYFGDDLPQRSNGGSSSAVTGVGPWRVTSFVEPYLSSSGSDNPAFFATDFVVDFKGPDDGNICYSSEQVIREMSELARIEGELISSCNFGIAGATRVGADVDIAELAKAFPVMDASSYGQAFPLAELTQIESGGNFQGQPPIQQYYLVTGAGNFVIAVAAVTFEGEEDASEYGSTRVVSIQKMDGAE